MMRKGDAVPSPLRIILTHHASCPPPRFAIGDQVTADLARHHQHQEKQAAERIWAMIDLVAGRAAAGIPAARAA